MAMSFSPITAKDQVIYYLLKALLAVFYLISHCFDYVLYPIYILIHR